MSRYLQLVKYPSATFEAFPSPYSWSHVSSVEHLLYTTMIVPDLSTMFNSLRAAGGRANGDGAKKTRTRDRPKAVPAPEANAELQVNIDVC
jgi:hypothetical protein